MDETAAFRGKQRPWIPLSETGQVSGRVADADGLGTGKCMVVVFPGFPGMFSTPSSFKLTFWKAKAA